MDCGKNLERLSASAVKNRKRLVMAGKYPVSGEQYRTIDRRMREIMRQLDQAGDSPLDPEWVASVLQTIIEGRGYEGDLIHGLFATPLQQLEMIKRLNQERGWGFTAEDFSSLGEAPTWPEDRLSVVILDASLYFVQETFETAWKLVKDTQPNHWRWDGLRSDSDHLRLLSGEHQRGLQWQVLDLEANQNCQPEDVRSAITSPSSAVLWMAYYSPQWIQSMNGKDVPFVWIPGYEVTVPGYRPWCGVPLLYWKADGRQVELHAYGCGDRGERWAVPVLIRQ